jgi:hypothetical protein
MPPATEIRGRRVTPCRIVCGMSRIPLKIGDIFRSSAIVVFVDMQGTICIFLTDTAGTKLHRMIASHCFTPCSLLAYLGYIRAIRNYNPANRFRGYTGQEISPDRRTSTHTSFHPTRLVTNDF